MKKRFTLVLALLLVLALSLSAGCGGGGGNSGSSAGSNSGSGSSSNSGGSNNNSGNASGGVSAVASGAAAPAASAASTSNSGDLPPDTTRRIIGETKEAEGIVVTLDEIWLSSYHKSHFDPPPEGFIYFYPHLTITNREYDGQLKDEMEFSSAGIGCFIGEERYPRSMNSLFSYEGSTKTMDQVPKVKLGDTVKGMSGYEIPENWDEITLVVNHMFPAMVMPSLDIRFTIVNPDYDPVRGEREKIEKAQAEALKALPDPSFPVINLKLGEEYENDVFSIAFTETDVFDYRGGGESFYTSRGFGFSEYCHLELYFKILTKGDTETRFAFLDRSVNESIFDELGFNSQDIAPNTTYQHNIKSSKIDEIELEPSDIETVRYHLVVFDAEKSSRNYREALFYEGYVIFNMT